jgi:predicted nucleic acid-binding protein
MIYLDATILVCAVHGEDPHHDDCLPLVSRRDAVTSAHALAETFSTMTGRREFLNEDVAEALASIAEIMRIEPILVSDYLTVLDQTRRRGIRGGLVYDALHAEVARRLKVDRLLTYNISNFQHVAADLQISAP